MADFCRQCWGEPYTQDLANLTTPVMDACGFYPVVLCEGCGAIQVNHKGECVSEDCLENGHVDK